MAVVPEAPAVAARDAVAASPAPLIDSREVARLCLLDAFACALRALRDPQCARCVGPVVPGATLVCGARVPGTSHTLDPPQAAYALALLFRWDEANDPAFATPAGHPAEALGGLLGVADYASLQRLAAGRPPLTVDDLGTALLRTHERRGLPSPVGTELRAALAAESASLLGGDAAAVERALEFAGRGAGSVAGPRWQCAEINAAGVRDALLALRGAQHVPAAAVPPAVAPGQQAPVLVALAIGRNQPPWPAIDGYRIRQRLLDAVVHHYPAKQAAAIAVLLEDTARLGALPLNALVSAFVRN